MGNAYDIADAFERIEDLLISNMKANLTHHLNEENLDKLNYVQWQALQLDALNNFRESNPKLFYYEFIEINKQVEDMLINTYVGAETKTENKFLKNYIGKKVDIGEDAILELRRLHDVKLHALIDEVVGNLKSAESAILRVADDAYRKIIFNSQVYLNSGAGTLSSAIDMASHDFLAQGLNCVQYKNGALVNIRSYSEMALRTANTRAGLQGEACKRDEWGEPLVMVTYRSSACPFCTKYIGKVFFDDVWGTIPASGSNTYPLLSSAIAAGLYHPNCKDSHTTYFKGVTERKTMTKEEKEEAARRYDLQQQQRYNERQIRKYKRLEQGSISQENVERYATKRKEWQNKNKEFINANADILRRDYSRESVKIN